MMADQLAKPAYDKFILRKVFPDPKDILAEVSPKVRDLGADCLFVLDTNTLLATYPLSEGSFEDIERIFKGLAENGRLFVPVQVIREFGRNRSTALTKAFDLLHTKKSSLPAPLPNAASLKCPLLEHHPEYQPLVDSVATIRRAVKDYEGHLNALIAELKDWTWTDRVSRLYAELFSGERIIDHKVSDEDIEKDLEWRTTHSIPPGYKDKAKPDGGIGDLLIWHTILELGRSKRKHIIFVCNEEKPDWIIRTNDVVIGTREELRQEFFRITGCHFAIAGYSAFLGLMGAKQETVSRVKQAEEIEGLGFLLVQQRVSRILQRLNAVAEDFLANGDDAGTGYGYIRDEGFDGLVLEFVRAKEKYVAVIHSEVGSEFLRELEESVLEIRALNERLRFLEMRMKHSGDEETVALKGHCRRFRAVFGKWSQWYLAGSP